MDWNIAGVIGSLVGLSIAVIGHAFATIWWAAKVTYTLESIQKNMSEIKSDLKAEIIERDVQIKALWKRQDELREKIITLEAGR